MTKYMAVTFFASALRSWSSKPSRPTDKAPCGWLEDADAENEALATTFNALCERHDLSEQMTYLTSAIIKYERHLQVGYDELRGKTDVSGSFNSADRVAHVRLRPMKLMIDVLKDWNSELNDLATYTSPAQRPHANRNIRADQPA